MQGNKFFGENRVAAGGHQNIPGRINKQGVYASARDSLVRIKRDTLPAMTKVTLQFQTPQDFSKFRNLVSGQVTTTNIGDLTITCRCSDELVAHAMNMLGGRVVREFPGE
jgi:hypothetical protein